MFGGLSLLCLLYLGAVSQHQLLRKWMKEADETLPWITQIVNWRQCEAGERLSRPMGSGSCGR